MSVPVILDENSGCLCALVAFLISKEGLKNTALSVEMYHIIK
jgi:hypothetical protein